MRQLLTGYDIKWRECSHYQGRVLPDLMVEYRRWIQQMLREYDEMPLGYYEWTVTGHLAIAASKLGYYVLQEYPIESRIRDDESPKRPRADLYVRTSRRDYDYVFEVKQVWLELGWDESRIEKQLEKVLRAARDKLYRYRGAAHYRCSIVVAPVWIKIDDWKHRCDSAGSYSQAKAKLRDTLTSVLERLPCSTVSYWGGFLCTYREAKNEYKKGSGERKPWDPIVGLVFLGRIIPPGHRGR